jgi:hypothetical protein
MIVALLLKSDGMKRGMKKNWSVSSQIHVCWTHLTCALFIALERGK